MAVSVDQVLGTLREELGPETELRSVLKRTAEILGSELGASHALALALKNGAFVQAVEWSLEPLNGSFDNLFLNLADSLHKSASKLPHALIVDRLAEFVFSRESRQLLNNSGIHSALAVTCRHLGEPWTTIILFRQKSDPTWRPADALLLERAAAELSLRAPLFQISPQRARQPQGANTIDSLPEEGFYRRLVENSDAIVFHTNAENVFQFVSRRALDFFGVVPEDFVGSVSVEWFDLVHLDDRQGVRKQALQAQALGRGFEQEFRVINHVTGRERWLLVKFVPVFDQRRTIRGWDGFGVDITSRRETQEALDVQSRKVRALYTVSAAVRGYLDPANIAARGLIALCDATDAEAGQCYLYSEHHTPELELVAHTGLSPHAIEHALPKESLYHQVAQSGQSFVVADMLSDIRARNLLEKDEGFRSAVLVPIAAEEEVFGTLALFQREAGRFDGGDVMLVAAAANQIGLAARQATLFRAYQKQAKNLSALYRMSHELSHLHTLEEVFLHAFTIIRDELGLKRIWLGLVNEDGTRLIGQAAYGPGWRKRLVEMDLDIGNEENALQSAIRGRKAISLQDPEEVLGELGLRRFFSRFAIKTLGIAPLIAGGQVLGLLAVQPSHAETNMDEEELNLLSSLANEIATLILTRRLESRISEADKMRSAGLLAAGIAHNFNNLLQAILGQSSLLEMQKNNPNLVEKAARIIGESATKGAGLVKQLLSFANLEDAHPIKLNVNQLIESELTNWSALLKSNQHIKLSLKSGIPLASADPRHVVRIILVLLSNAVEAMQEKGGPIQIFTDEVDTRTDVSLVEVPDGNYVRIGVRDSGIGMDAETRRRCFEPFFTTKNVDPGTGLGLSGGGLGLAAAYALARKNGGRLVVHSRLGHGSCFTLYIPVHKVASVDEQKTLSNPSSIIQKEDELERKIKGQTR